MTKSIDMRFHWIKDRVRQQQFIVRFVRGLANIADFFTKALPVARHRVLAPLIAIDPGDYTIDIDNAKIDLSSLFAALLHKHFASCGCVDSTVVGIDSYLALYGII